MQLKSSDTLWGIRTCTNSHALRRDAQKLQQGKAFGASFWARGCPHLLRCDAQLPVGAGHVRAAQRQAAGQCSLGLRTAMPVGMTVPIGVAMPVGQAKGVPIGGVGVLVLRSHHGNGLGGKVGQPGAGRQALPLQGLTHPLHPLCGLLKLRSPSTASHCRSCACHPECLWAVHAERMHAVLLLCFRWTSQRGKSLAASDRAATISLLAPQQRNNACSAPMVQPCHKHAEAVACWLLCTKA